MLSSVSLGEGVRGRSHTTQELPCLAQGPALCVEQDDAAAVAKKSGQSSGGS